jgi:hypothetical protein
MAFRISSEMMTVPSAQMIEENSGVLVGVGVVVLVDVAVGPGVCVEVAVGVWV